MPLSRHEELKRALRRAQRDVQRPSTLPETAPYLEALHKARRALKEYEDRLEDLHALKAHLAQCKAVYESAKKEYAGFLATMSDFADDGQL